MSSPLAAALSLLGDARTATDRATAMELAADSANESLRRFFAQKAHLAIRGGAPALLREALAEPLDSAPRTEGDRFVAEHGALGVRMKCIANTRSPSASDARIRVLETRGNIGHAAFTRDGERIMAFVSGEPSWPALGSNSVWSFIVQWHARTGEFVSATRVGQFREGEGTFALSPDGSRVAVRSHRSTHVHAIERTTHAVSPEVSANLHGTEGANSLLFLADGRVIADDGYDVVVYRSESGEVLHRITSLGAGPHATSSRQLFVGAGSGRPVATVVIHSLTTFALEGVATANSANDPPRQPLPAPRWNDIVGSRHGAIVASLAISPSASLLASGDWQRDVRIWNVDTLSRCAGTTREPTTVEGRRIGVHDGWVTALAFASDDRLLSGGWDGAVIDFDLRDGASPPRWLYGHAGRVVALDVARDGTVALSAGSDGNVVLWDLARGESTRPPFWFDYGGHRAPISIEVTREHVRIAVGHREVRFDHAGTLLDTGSCEPSREASKPIGGFIEVHGFESSAIDVDVTGYDRHDELEGESVNPCPALVIRRDDALVDVITLEASALAFAWVDANTLVVLDAGGHVSFWRWL